MRKPPKHFTQICLVCDKGGRRCSRHSRRVLAVNGNTGVQVWETVDKHGTQVLDYQNEYVYIEYSRGLPSGGVIPTRGHFENRSCQRHLLTGSFPEVYYTNVVAEWQIDNTMEKFLKVLIAKGNVSTDKLCNVLYWLCLLAVREHRSVHFCWSGAQVKIRKNSNSLCTLCDQCARQIQAHDNCSILRQDWCGSDHISGAIFSKTTQLDVPYLKKHYAPRTIVF